jgi:UDP-2,4-diacetamido-2,4,6-trideoxy-beta-L-altropyranose hydrolase
MSNELGQTIVFRADASTTIGGGHLSRCLALADSLIADGARCSLATVRETGRVVQWRGRFDAQSIELPAGADAAAEARILAARFATGVDWLVVDHYGRDATFESQCRPWARNILVIDDLADRAHDCDLLLDQTSTGRVDDYRPLVPADCRLLLGPSYALLRPQFRRHRQQVPSKAGTLRRVFVSFGAVDAHDFCSIALQAVAETGLDIPVDIVIGRQAPHRSRVEALAASLPASVTVHSDVGDMAALMAKADLAIGAAGVTSWERCALGLPTIVVAVAENQRLVAAELRARGAALVLGDACTVTAAELTDAVQSLARDTARRESMSAAGLAMCDGLGAERVRVALTAPIRASDGRRIDLRPATRNDVDLLLQWQSDPSTRRFARNPAIPDAATHRAWLDARLADPNCLLNIVMVDSGPAGALRLDRLSSRTAVEQWEISIYVDPAQYRKGIAKAALTLARRLLPEAWFIAEVQPENAASRALFASAGYVAINGRYEQRPTERYDPVNGALAP